MHYRDTQIQPDVCTEQKRVERDTAASHCMAARCTPLQGADVTQWQQNGPETKIPDMRCHNHHGRGRQDKPISVLPDSHFTDELDGDAGRLHTKLPYTTTSTHHATPNQHKTQFTEPPNSKSPILMIAIFEIRKTLAYQYLLPSSIRNQQQQREETQLAMCVYMCVCEYTGDTGYTRARSQPSTNAPSQIFPPETKKRMPQARTSSHLRSGIFSLFLQSSQYHLARERRKVLAQWLD